MEKTKTLRKKIAFTSKEYYAGNPTKIKIVINPEMQKLIAKAKKILKENSQFNKISIDASATLLDDNNKEANFHPNAEQLIVYSDGVYYYAQSKYDASTQIESEDLKL